MSTSVINENHATAARAPCQRVSRAAWPSRESRHPDSGVALRPAKFATRDQQEVAVVEIRRDDDIGDAGFVFHGKEDEALGCARALAGNDAASGAHEVSVLTDAQFCGGQDVAATQCGGII
jgi:hypothetical protein